jgi:hypothetical protein
MAKKRDPSPRSIRATIDRIEEGIAVLVTDDGFRWHLSSQLLPEGSSEGEVLEVRFMRDPGETTRRTEAVRDLQSRLLRRNG